MKAIDVNHLSFSYENGNKALNDISFTVKPGKIVGLLGPNGSGKSTLLNIISGVLRYEIGSVKVFGKEVKAYHRHEIARVISVVSQEFTPLFAFTVKDIVWMGRMPYSSVFHSSTKEEIDLVDKWMEKLEIKRLERRSIKAISGGERQRTVIARAFVQEPQLLLLDEFTAHLDIGHRADLIGVIKKKNEEEDTTVLGAFHDVNVAAQMCDEIILLKDAEIVAMGNVFDVITEKNVSQVYNTDVVISHHPTCGVPQVMLKI